MSAAFYYGTCLRALHRKTISQKLNPILPHSVLVSFVQAVMVPSADGMVKSLLSSIIRIIIFTNYYFLTFLENEWIPLIRTPFL